MPHSRHVLLKSRFALVRRDLDPLLDRITPDVLNWAPVAGMRTISGQIVEIVSTEMQIIALLREGKQISDEEALEIIGDSNDLQNLRRALLETREKTFDYLDSLSGEQLTEEVPFDGGWFASLMLPIVPRAEIFLNIADHEWYHVGQLTSYLWALGHDPYEW